MLFNHWQAWSWLPPPEKGGPKLIGKGLGRHAAARDDKAGKWEVTEKWDMFEERPATGKKRMIFGERSWREWRWNKGMGERQETTMETGGLGKGYKISVFSTQQYTLFISSVSVMAMKIASEYCSLSAYSPVNSPIFSHSTDPFHCMWVFLMLKPSPHIPFLSYILLSTHFHDLF